MLISYNFLAQYVDLAGVSVEELCQKLTEAGIEVEAVKPLGVIPDGIVVAEILERNPHPNADKLSVCKVFDGEKEVQIVCGAPNCDAGNKIPLATLGTCFKDDEGVFEIKKAKLRGVESFGMMCSSRELGLSEEHDGLLILPADTKLGTPVSELFKGDWQIEVEVTPNRADWLSQWGVARDVSCLFNAEAKLPELNYPTVNKQPLPENLVTVTATDECVRYTAQVIRNVKIAESPEWLKSYINSVGLRPINNIVDITNFILMELGQPLHAFDYDTLAEGRIVVRTANESETITLLDGKKIDLEPHHLVICDAEKPLALAGIMGGEASGISDSTTTVLLESAVFNSSLIRATSRKLGVSSDSSYRFERGVDPDMAEFAGKRAVQLICEIAGGEVISDFVDVYTSRPEEKKIPCRFDKVRNLIGIEITNDEMVDIFRKLRLSVDSITADSCVVTAPIWRPDLEREADLSEEVARIRGLDAIPVIPVRGTMVDSIRDDARVADSELRDELISLGLFECMNYSMVSIESALSDTRFAEEDVICITNPLSLELKWMRPSLWGEMLQSVERNISRRNLNFALFEQSRVFCKNPKLFPEERHEVCIMLTGSRHPEFYGKEATEVYDFYDMKGLIETLLQKRNIANYQFKAAEDSRFEYGECAELKINGKVAGHFGKLAKSYTNSWRTQNAVYGATLEVSVLMTGSGSILAEAIPTFPATSRDVAFVAPDELTHAEIVRFIKGLKLQNFEAVELFDIFSDAKVLGEGKKSMAYRVTFRNAERTLKDEEVNSAFEQLRAKLAKKLSVELR